MNKTNLQENPMNLVCLFICWCSSPISTSENCVKSCVSIDPTQLSHQIDHRRPVVIRIDKKIAGYEKIKYVYKNAKYFLKVEISHWI